MGSNPTKCINKYKFSEAGMSHNSETVINKNSVVAAKIVSFLVRCISEDLTGQMLTFDEAEVFCKRYRGAIEEMLLGTQSEAITYLSEQLVLKAKFNIDYPDQGDSYVSSEVLSEWLEEQLHLWRNNPD